ncbi:ER-golgi trafficking TRAPP I complex 85 kDa subunit-domain-containing protein [Aspergillus transmontanensis]|uniref:ER-golgi trafficking TRAPP I complex 85 kDa subunit-domain-containing protein n=1 Tax=Aspergillus transmontanensis TaxID=1034304 RepID=A0A5N6VYI4_9EURO|nr:ER-golgi trafficking TRAPP I complex 85 kDa subunit-domain-containing protein [Aspergillus transmontanensis]
MTSPGDAAPVRPPPSFSPGVPRVASKTRYPDQRRDSSSNLDSDLVDSRIATSPPQPPLSATAAELPIRSASPHARSIRSSTPQLARSSLGSPTEGRLDGSEDIRSLIIRSFSPVVGVYASVDTDELVRQKGFAGGFWELIRPFGETVPGKIVVRDSVGASRGWEDYGVRFVDLGGNPQVSSEPRAPPLTQLEEALERQLESPDDPLGGILRPKDFLSFPTTSPLYKSFLRQLLSVSSPTPHETFLHPVASVIAISSRNTSPLETLRRLYADTSNGDRKLLEWVHPEYLRYYVLVHDEDRDDITESTKLYDQMKRHFGLHCHLLRLRSNQCVVTDDDSCQVPEAEWLSPTERLSGRSEPLVDLDTDGLPYLFESDVTAIKAFVRELVAQSVIPYMENRVTVWNDQVASRRRGISGRFMSMSRRWAGFGSGSRSSLIGSSGGTSGNYDLAHGFYKPDVPEAILRKMADFAFMLRDWKLSASTYELLRSDYANDKAWKYHAGAHEMCAVSMLLNPLSMPGKSKINDIDQMIETACYSYLTRCSDAPHALRCLCLSMELLKSRGGSGIESAARWAMRAMDLSLVGSIGQALLSERISACYASRNAINGVRFGSRHRKAGMWSVLAADRWLRLGKPSLASASLEEAERLYADVLDSNGAFPIPEMQAFVDNLRHAVKVEYLESRGLDTGDEAATADPLDAFEPEETSEKLDKRKNRKSLIANPMDSGGLSSAQGARDDDNPANDDFERA